MICPHCGNENTRVIDSRLNKEKNSIRRRRECERCSFRFTTYEVIEDLPFIVVKKDGRREVFDRIKLRNGILRAFEKRKISSETIENVINDVEDLFFKSKNMEVSSSAIGEFVMKKLLEIDEVAYIRFISVFKEFDDLSQFIKELNTIQKRRKK